MKQYEVFKKKVAQQIKELFYQVNVYAIDCTKSAKYHMLSVEKYTRKSFMFVTD